MPNLKFRCTSEGAFLAGLLANVLIHEVRFMRTLILQETEHGLEVFEVPEVRKLIAELCVDSISDRFGGIAKNDMANMRDDLVNIAMVWLEGTPPKLPHLQLVPPEDD